MTEETGAAAPSAEQATPSAPAESEQAKPETSVANADAEPEAETKAKPESEADDSAPPEEGEADDKPRKPSRYERMQRRIRALTTELESMRATFPAPSSSQEPGKSSAEQPPREDDFNGDYFAYQRALTAHEVKQALRGELTEERQRSASERQAALRREASEEFLERSEEIKGRVTDFDAAFETFAKQGGNFAPHVIEELTQSEHGPLLAYQLAKNPRKAAEINAMSARDAAREIGRLEAKVTLPAPKKTTQAPPPLKTPTGGASPPTDMFKAAKSEDISDFVKIVRTKK